MKDLSRKELVGALGREGAPEMMGPRMEQPCFNPDALLIPSLYHTLSISDYEVTLEGNALPTSFLFICLSFFLAALGLGYARAFSSCGEHGFLCVACVSFSLQWLLLLQSTGCRHVGFSGCST